MQKPNLNVMIFDDDEEPSRQQDMKRYTVTNRSGKPSSSNGQSMQNELKRDISGQKMSVISRQLNDLEMKIKSIQREGERIKLQMERRALTLNGSNVISSIPNNKNTKQIEQVLMIVEKKIQVIIQESRKLIGRVTETVGKRLSRIQKQQSSITVKSAIPVGNQQNNKLNQIQLSVRQKLQQYEQFYKVQFEKLVKESKRKQEMMMKRLSEMQLKFANRVNAFETKEKQLVDWIHHLEAKLKDRKSKKMITITQEKPQVSPIVSKGQSVVQSDANVSHNQINNNPSTLQQVPSSLNYNYVQTSRANLSIDQGNSSKVVRKHKIFGDKSTSPVPRNNQKVSPTKDSVMPQKDHRQVTNQSSAVSSSFHKQQSLAPGSNLNFYNELRRQQTQKVTYPYNHNQVRNQPQQQQYKFADLNDFNQQYTQSEQDDFFAPIEADDVNGNYERVLANIPLDSRGGTYYRETQNNNNYGYESNSYDKNQNNSDKVFSPFDLN